MIKALTDAAVRYAQNYIKQNDLFHTRDKLDPIMERAASSFHMEPFQNGWARYLRHGKLYGVSYIHQYEEELTEMFQAGVINSSSKMSAGKMREVSLSTYPNRFLLPVETEIRQMMGSFLKRRRRIDCQQIITNQLE